MMPQSHFMVLAPIAAGRDAELRALLATMNRGPGLVDAHNSIFPFAEFPELHYARFVVLGDNTSADITAYGLQPRNYSLYLAFLGDYDGVDIDYLAQMAQRAGNGLSRIFSHCQGYKPGTDVAIWMRHHNLPVAANYVNWVGRTVRQVREEYALRQSLEGYHQANSTSLAAMSPREIHRALRNYVNQECDAGRLTLSSFQSPPISWQVLNLMHAIIVPAVLLLFAPLLFLYLPFFLFQLRRREKSDPVIAPRIDPAHAKELADIEDLDVTNQFNAIGTLKPGLFRRWLTAFVLWVINYTVRHIYNRGTLARVKTIHFARWVFLDNKQRVYFASNYDGNLESYMDDFINKVGFGLNLVFSNGIAYPRTNWLIFDGAKDEQNFKYVLRRHEGPTEVWYKAYPGLSAMDLTRNAQIREGIENPAMTDTKLEEWIQLL
jgi:hypothetical protein